jgi:hypothetical protein
MFLLLAIQSLADTTITTDRLCRVETRRDLHRLHSRGRVLVTDTAVHIKGSGTVRLDGYFGPGGYTLGPSPGSVPLEFSWRLGEDTIHCGESRTYTCERRRGRDRFACLTNTSSGPERCRVGLVLGDKTIIFVRFKLYTDIYVRL